MLAVTLMPTLRSTLSQQSEINDLRTQLGQKRETVAAMQQEQRQWSDPVFIEQQARERLKFVRVGETSYTVIGAKAAPPRVTGPKIAAPVRAYNVSSPWYGQLWQSIVIADTPAKVAVKAPAKAPSSSKPKPSPSAK
jgi:hypothetical protein